MNRGLPAAVLLTGIARLALFNRTGFAAIGDTRQAFLSSLSPLLAFLLVMTSLLTLSSGWQLGLAYGLQTLCLMLGFPVITNFFAVLWKREDSWLRYATAANWCQLVIQVFGIIVFLVSSLFTVSPPALIAATSGATVIYWLVLNWFLIWRGLNLSVVRALLFLLTVVAALVLLLVIPISARMAQTGTAVPHLPT